MLRCVTLLALLVITWTQQAGSTSMCSEKCKTKDHDELFSLMDKTEAATMNILHSPEHKKILHDLCQKFKSKICELDLDAKAISKLREVSEKYLEKIQNGTMDENLIISFLNNDPMKQIEAFIETLQKKKNEATTF